MPISAAAACWPPGRFEYQKGYDMLIEAFAQVHAKHPDWELRICGHGKLRPQFEQAIAEHGLGDVVELPGPSEDLPGEMEQASIYALSSRFEGFPLVLLEAMGKGMGVVAFDCPTGPRDIVEDRRNGILVPPKDPDAFAAGLLALIEDEELRRRCGAAAAETAQRVHDRGRRPALGGAVPRPRLTVRLLIMNAFTVGGTIRATFTLAGELAKRHDVEIVSVYRLRAVGAVASRCRPACGCGR